MELVKQSCGIISKKISSLLSGSRQRLFLRLALVFINELIQFYVSLGNETTPMDKRLKKISEAVIGHTMIECGGVLGKLQQQHNEIETDRMYKLILWI